MCCDARASVHAVITVEHGLRQIHTVRLHTLMHPNRTASENSQHL